MRIILMLLMAAYILPAQAAQADILSGCRTSCYFYDRIAKCEKVAKLPEATEEERSDAYSYICIAYLKADVRTRPMLGACTWAAARYPTAMNYGNLGAAQIMRGDYKAAIRSLRRGVEIGLGPGGYPTPDLGTLYYNLALAYDGRRERKMALAYAIQAQHEGDAAARRLRKKLSRPTLPARR